MTDMLREDLLALVTNKETWTRREFVVSTRATGFALWLSAFPLAAFAQQPATVGDLLDQGGKKQTKDEFTKLLSGATISGIQAQNPSRKFEITYKEDSSISGRGWEAIGGGNVSGVFGTWSVNDQGQLCHHFKKIANLRIWFQFG